MSATLPWQWPLQNSAAFPPKRFAKAYSPSKASPAARNSKARKTESRSSTISPTTRPRSASPFRACARSIRHSRLWVLFEPRSNTTRRKVFQKELAEALALADFAIVAAIPDLHKIPENDRLDPVKLSADIAAGGGKGYYLADNAAIIAEVKKEAKPGDVVAVLSNGGFGGIHEQLLGGIVSGLFALQSRPLRTIFAPRSFQDRWLSLV